MLIHEMHLCVRLVRGVLRVRLGLLDPLFVRDRNYTDVTHILTTLITREPAPIFSQIVQRLTLQTILRVVLSVFGDEVNMWLPRSPDLKPREWILIFFSMVKNKGDNKESNRAVMLPVSHHKQSLDVQYEMWRVFVSGRKRF